jgi:hypothetical protein
MSGGGDRKIYRSSSGMPAGASRACRPGTTDRLCFAADRFNQYLDSPGKSPTGTPYA